MKVLSAVLAAFAGAVFSQTPQLPRFEVASIKAANFPPGVAGSGFAREAPGGRLTIEMSPASSLISLAYGLRGYQILGGPDWINSTRYNIEAKAEKDASADQINLMLRSLLEDRFQLKLHSETKDFPLYELVVAKGGSKIKLAEVQNPTRGGPAPGLARRGRGEIDARAVPLAALAQILSGQLDRPVIDKTELKGLYDILLRWVPESGVVLRGDGFIPNPPEAAGPSIFTAVQEQLGLKLEAVKGPVDVLVIDSIEKPTEN